MARSAIPPITERCLSRRAAIAAALAAASAAPMIWASPRTLAQPSTPVAADDASFPPGEALSLTTIVAEHLGQGAIPGALVGLWSPDRGTWVQAMGIGDLATAGPITMDDHLRIASITKTFTATVVLQLVDEGSPVPGRSARAVRDRHCQRRADHRVAVAEYDRGRLRLRRGPGVRSGV